MQIVPMDYTPTPVLPLSRRIKDSDALRLAAALNLDTSDTAEGMRLIVRPYERKRARNALQFISDPNDVTQFTAIRCCDLDNDELRVFLSGLKGEDGAVIRDAFRLPEPTHEHEARLHGYMAATAARNADTVKSLHDIMAMPKPTYDSALSLTDGRTLAIDQGSAGIIRKGSAFDRLATMNVATCAVVIMRNRERDAVALAHIDAATDPKSLEAILGELRGSPQEPVDVTLWGGKPEGASVRTMMGVVTALKEQPNIRITHADIMDYERPGAIAVSLDGKLRQCRTREMEKIVSPPEASLRYRLSQTPAIAKIPAPIQLDYNGESRILASVTINENEKRKHMGRINESPSLGRLDFTR